MRSSSSSTSYRRYNQDVSNKTHCDCPHPILVQVAWTLDNPGRRFKGCPVRDKRRKCDVYGFLDEELPSDYYKKLLFDLHEENKALKNMNNRSRGMDDCKKEIVSDSNDKMVMLYDLKEDLTYVKSKLNAHDRLMFIVFLCLIFLCLVIGYKM